MPQKTPHERCRLILTDLQHNDAVRAMPKIASVETNVAGKECHTVQFPKDHRNVIVLDAFLVPIHADLMDRNPSRLQQLALTFEYIFVQKNQAGRRSGLALLAT